MKTKLRSQFVRLILSSGYRKFWRLLAEFRRLLLFRTHIIKVFLQLDDPYSYLLSYYLQSLSETYKVDIRVYLSLALGSEYMPRPTLLAGYAARDCQLLARELGIPFLDQGDKPVVEQRAALLDFLAREQGQEDFQATMHAALGHYWRGDTEAVARLLGRNQAGASETGALLAKNQLALGKLGHYNCATIYYAGEWYWGVDRLAHLCTRLDGLGARRNNTEQSSALLMARSQTMQLKLPLTAPASAKNLPPLELYCSFRSPYSYLALQRIFDLADAYGLQLDIRPVLPMVMRGLPVPRNKILYIIKDAAREAERLDIPFGKLSDPLGLGAERCIAVFYYAKSQAKEREFMLCAGRAIWFDAIDVATDAGMRVVIERAGLLWPDVIKALAVNDWHEAAESNRVALGEAGLWGVPCFIMGDVVLWGQDRIWLLARQIEDRCLQGSE